MVLETLVCSSFNHSTRMITRKNFTVTISPGMRQILDQNYFDDEIKNISNSYKTFYHSSSCVLSRDLISYFMERA